MAKLKNNEIPVKFIMVQYGIFIRSGRFSPIKTRRKDVVNKIKQGEP